VTEASAGIYVQVIRLRIIIGHVGRGGIWTGCPFQ